MLPEAGIGTVQARHVVRQQGIAGTQRHVEGVVAIGGGHDVRTGIVAEGAQGRRVWANVGLNCRHGGGRLLERRAPVAMSRHLNFIHATVVRGTRRSLEAQAEREKTWHLCEKRKELTHHVSVGLAVPLPLSVPLLSSAELRLPPGPFHSLLSLLGQLGGGQRGEEQVRPRTGVVPPIQVFDKPERNANIEGQESQKDAASLWRACRCKKG